MNKTMNKVNPISRVKRNHGLEHATLHVLGKKFPKMSFGGISSPLGFTIIGGVSTEDVAEAAIEALKRLRAGEANLAMHDNCGTNYAVTGAFVGLFAWLGTIGSEKKFSKKLERLPLVVLLATLAFIIARPLGPMIQEKLTTSGQPGALELERVETSVRAGLHLHHVITRG